MTTLFNLRAQERSLATLLRAGNKSVIPQLAAVRRKLQRIHDERLLDFDPEDRDAMAQRLGFSTGNDAEDQAG